MFIPHFLFFLILWAYAIPSLSTFGKKHSISSFTLKMFLITIDFLCELFVLWLQ